VGDRVATNNSSRRDALLLAGILAIGGVLRLLHLGAPSFWLDEALSVAYARLPWSQFAHLMQNRELNMLPYYIILRGWLHFGADEWIVRSLSALCSIATLPLFYALGARLFGTRVGRIGVLLLALNPYHIRFAQEARGYSLMLLLVTASTLLLVRAIDSPSRPPAVWTSYVVTAVLAAYTHFYATLAILAQWVSIAIVRPRGTPWKRLALSAFAIGVLLVPLAAFVLLGHADPAEWIPTPSWKRVEFLVYSLLGGDNTHGARIFAWPVYAAVLIAAAASTRDAWRMREGERAREAWHYTLVVSGAALPILLVLVASIFKPIFVDKYLMECLPFVVLLVAVGVERVRPRALSLGATILLLTISAHALVGYYRSSDKDDWRSATRYVLDSSRAGDAVLFYPSYAVAPFDYYRALRDSSAHDIRVVYPGTFGEGDVGAAVSGVQHRYDRLWAVFNQDGDSGAVVRDSLGRRYRVESDSQFTGVRVVLYDTR
jgi:mannosyltransferase